jgi:hypothetical protein
LFPGDVSGVYQERENAAKSLKWRIAVSASRAMSPLRQRIAKAIDGAGSNLELEEAVDNVITVRFSEVTK